MNDDDLAHLRRCVQLATEALEAGDEPFGSVLVAADGTVLAEDRNRVATGDRTRHPEFELARWAAAHMTPPERAAATVYTSGEHCPRCAPPPTAGSGWVASCMWPPPSSWPSGVPSWEFPSRRSGPCRSRRSSPAFPSRARFLTSPKRSTPSSAASTAHPERRGRLMVRVTASGSSWRVAWMTAPCAAW